MATVKIAHSLFKKIEKKFKGETHKIIDLFYTLEENPSKGKILATIGKVTLKEIKYKSFRFYFIIDNYQIKILSSENLKNLLVKFIRMSNKNTQQKTIDEIKPILRNLGSEGF